MTIDIYSYCNYKDSSVGFQIGKVDLKSGKIYRADSIPQYITRSFESSLVHNAYGRYPGNNSTRYFYLLKHIDYIDKYPEPDKYMNIAFECSDISVYNKLKHFLNSMTREQKSKLFGEMVFTDTSNSEYEMKFDVKQLDLFLNRIDNETVNKDKNCECFNIVSLYERKEPELKDLFQLKKPYSVHNDTSKNNNPPYHYRFIKGNSVKKKIILLLLIILVILIGVIIKLSTS